MFKKQAKPYHHDHGDIIYGEYSDYIYPYKDGCIGADNILLLGYFDQHPWRALELVAPADSSEIAEMKLLCTYDCPYTKRDYQAMIPLAILSDNVEKYCSLLTWSREAACDRSWNLDMDTLERIKFGDVTTVEALVMGSGYTTFCLASDGCWSKVPILLDMENGDRMVALTFVWHNK